MLQSSTDAVASGSKPNQSTITSGAAIDSNITATVAAVASAAATPSSSSAQGQTQNQTATLPQYHITPAVQGSTKYAQLLALIDELGECIYLNDVQENNHST